jgi:hypothetical protein
VYPLSPWKVARKMSWWSERPFIENRRRKRETTQQKKEKRKKTRLICFSSTANSNFLEII